MEKTINFYSEVVIIGTVIGVVLICWTIRRLASTAANSPFRREFEKEKAAIALLSIEEARAKSAIVLEDSTRFKAIRTDSHVRDLPAFGPTLLEFFSTYRLVASTKGEFRISDSFLGEPPRESGAIKVGTDLDFCEYLALPDKDEIIEAYAGETTSHRSVHHLILLEDWLNSEAARS